MKRKVLWGCLALLFLITAGSVVRVLSQPAVVYRVYVDNEDVGTVSSFAEYTEILADLLAREESQVGLNLMFQQEISAQRELLWESDKDVPVVKTGLAARVSYSTVGWAIVIDDEPMLWAATREDAQQILAEVTDFYTHDSDKYTLLSAEIVEQVDIRPQEVVPESIWAVETAVNYVLQGREKSESYVVAKGDSLWSISRSVNISQSDLKKANPCLAESNVLKVGQVINLVSAEPKLNVCTIEQLKTHESIPYTTNYRYTNNRWSNQSSVVKNGVAGRKVVTYQVECTNGIETKRKALHTKVESQPVTRVVERGTSKWPSAATGMFRWPMNTGYITSYFGPRRGGTHGGVDIAAPTGTPIYAAAAGTVAVAQWGSSYGNYVKIDHGNGYATLYAHASTLLVKSGQRVSKGQVIARVGSTGNSTGPHLHYEIQRQGNRINPLQFYKP